MNEDVAYPDMRAEVVSALESLSDPEHQRNAWGRVELDVNYYDDLTLNIHILYDDTEALPNPMSVVGSVLRPSDVDSLVALDRVLTPILDELGESPDSAYLAHPNWHAVVSAARSALTAMG